MRTGLRLLAIFVPLVGCSQQTDTSVVNDEDPLTSQNGLSSNGLTSNGLTSNGLSSNGLSSNGLSSNGLSSNGIVIAALRDKTGVGDASRMFFRYLVSCALPVGKTVTYTWIDSGGTNHTESNPGGLGLAPTWEVGPLDQAGQEIVSACLGARTNSLGVSVPISMRSNGITALAVSPTERATYTYGEGAFWGNLFNSGAPYLYSCSRAPYDAGVASSQYKAKGRTCSTQDCGIIKYLGRCLSSDHTTVDQTCFNRDKTYNDWADDCHSTLNKNLGTGSLHVITTWLLP
jgi:hypothetical protein